ncbi:hypothetical protein WMY93_007911 [Mugilogobius chulae]|uniref:G-protein coupled receptors family 1 profile domain-containing protein n=1 Tax=Mugilogobius chulae TaxID=88201 RepID=A0AAW0PED2_9GOBI
MPILSVRDRVDKLLWSLAHPCSDGSGLQRSVCDGVANQYKNMTEQQWITLISFKFAFSALTNLASLMFLVINGIIIYTLCSRPVFVETPRYMLLLNLVVADSIVLFMGQFLYLHSTFLVLLSYPLCGFYVMISYLSSRISPLTLTVMSIERYISVCFPFRHTNIVTMRNTVFAILSVWG